MPRQPTSGHRRHGPIRAATGGALVVRDLMTSELVALAPELPLRDAAAILNERHISGAPVVAGGRLLGVLSVSDLLEFDVAAARVPADRREMEGRLELEPAEEWKEGDQAPGAFFAEWWTNAGADAAEHFRETRRPESELLAEHSVAEVMSRTVCSVDPEDDLLVAARYMVRAGIHRLLVVQRGRPVGMLSAMDLVRAVADGRLRPV